MHSEEELLVEVLGSIVRPGAPEEEGICPALVPTEELIECGLVPVHIALHEALVRNLVRLLHGMPSAFYARRVRAVTSPRNADAMPLPGADSGRFPTENGKNCHILCWTLIRLRASSSLP